MRIDLSCPVELWHFRLPAPDKPTVSLHMFNLSDKTVVSMQAAFICYREDGERLSRQVERVNDLGGAKRSAFELDVLVEGGLDAARMDFVIEKVWFIDGTVWRRGREELADYRDNALPAGRQLDTLRHIVGPDARGYPSDQGAVWVCVCGRPNPAAAGECARCLRDKREVFTRNNKAAIETIIFQRESALEDKARQAREEAGRMQREREQKEMQRKRRRKRAIITGVTVVFLGASAWAVYFHGIPAYNYYRANELIESGEYTRAKEMFLALEDYRDAADMVFQSDYLRAGDTRKTGTLTSLKAAQDIYESISDYKDSARLALRMRYERAELLRNGAEYEQAIALYEELGDYDGAAEQALLARYQWANTLMDELDYSGARAMFLALGSYSDASRLAEECLYLPANRYLEQNEFAQAQALFEQMSDQERAQPRLKELYYRWGDALFGEKRFDEAAEKYILAGDYLDSSRKAALCLYEPAQLLMKEEKYAEAREKFLKIPYFEDAQKLAEQAAFMLGGEAARAGRYEEAISLLREAPSVAASLAAIREASYLWAEELEAQGDQEKAAELYSQATGYADAADQVLRLRYAMGIEAANARDFARAAEIFEGLGDYETSREEAQRARYNLAVTRLEAGSYEEAIADFEQLSGYSQSADYLKQAHYLLAGRLFGEGQLEAAAAHYLAADDYEDASERRRESVYLQAKALLDAGEREAATLLLKQVEDYRDARDILNSTAYELASQLKAAGDYRQAAEQFALISGYSDADVQADESYDLYYQDAYEAARAAIRSKDYKAAIDALEPLDRENPGEKYKNVNNMYQEAVYNYARELYNAEKPYEALPYYRKILDYKDVSSHRLTRVPYRILGTWQTADGSMVMEFREDGTCTIGGREYYFYAQNYALNTGDRPDGLDIAYSILNLTEKSFNLRRLSPRASYRMTRVDTP